MARSNQHYLEVLDEFSRLGIEFISFRENIDTGGALGRAIVVIIGAIAELERNLIVERVRAGMRRAKLEGRHIGRKPLEIDRQAIVRDRKRGMSLGEARQTSPRLPHQHRSGPQRRCPKRGPAITTATSTKQAAGNGCLRCTESCGFWRQ